jgi:hypothetical protein
MTAVNRHICETRRTSISCNNPILVSILFCSTSYAALSGLLDVETEDITGKPATGADLSAAPPVVGTGFKSDPLRDASNACSDSVATLATATSAPGPLSLPGSNSLSKFPQYNGP